MRVFIVLIILFCAVPGFSSGLIDETGDMTGAAGATNNREMQDIIVNLDRIQKAFDLSKADANIKTVLYGQKFTYKIRLREFMVTTIHLPHNEIIQSFILGDSQNFNFSKIEKRDNLFTVWGIRSGADTNLTVIGKSGNIYSFYIRIDSTESAYLPNLVYYVSDPFLKPLLIAKDKNEKKEIAKMEQHESDYLRELPYMRGKDINYNYKIKGGKKYEQK